MFWSPCSFYAQIVEVFVFSKLNSNCLSPITGLFFDFIVLNEMPLCVF